MPSPRKTRCNQRRPSGVRATPPTVVICDTSESSAFVRGLRMTGLKRTVGKHSPTASRRKAAPPSAQANRLLRAKLGEPNRLLLFAFLRRLVSRCLFQRRHRTLLLLKTLGRFQVLDRRQVFGSHAAKAVADRSDPQSQSSYVPPGRRPKVANPPGQRESLVAVHPRTSLFRTSHPINARMTAFCLRFP